MMVAVGALLTACGNAEADASGADTGDATGATQAAAVDDASWLAFSDRDKCELAPEAAKVVEAMMQTEREGGGYGMLVAKPASATVPGGEAPVRAVELADDPYQSPGIFLLLDEEWHGLPLRGLWANAATRQSLTENVPYDGVDIRLYFEDTPDLAGKLEAAGWTLSEVDPEYGEAMPVVGFSQQYFLDAGQKLVETPIDYEAEVNKRPGQNPKVDGREVGVYGMNTIVQLVESSAKPGMTYLTCNIYAST